MRNRYLGLATVLALALGMMLGQVLIGQAPQGGPPAAGGPPAGAPGGAGGGAPGAAGGGRGGAGGGQRGGGAPAAPAGPVVRGPDGKPDFTGYYMAATTTNINSGRGTILDDAGAKTGKIPYNAEWEAKSADTAKNHMFDEPYAHCLPAGVPTNFGIQMGFQVVQDKNSVVFAWDTVGGTRVIYTDNRKHIPANIKLYQGDSVGHWEGDTLVVDTTSQAAGWWDASGAVHSDATHVVERFTMMDSNLILYEATVEDPIALTRPMKLSDNFRRNLGAYPNSWGKRPTGYEQTETACVEGDMDMALYPVSAGGFSKDSTTGPSTQGVTAGAAGGGGRGGAGGGRGGAGAPGGAPGGGAPGAGAPGGAPGGGAPGGGGGGRGGAGRGAPGGAPPAAPTQ